MSNNDAHKKFVILHSNDIHGDFQQEVIENVPGKMLGGLSRLSGYINKVRTEEENVLYLVAGDMVQGSMIDSEFKGVSTMELMNYLSPDVATIGNHELDYGLYHLLFLEKMANFPIVVSNVYLKKFHKRLMQPFVILEVEGFSIMVIGIITDEIMANLKMDTNIGSHLSLEAASTEVGRICNAYKDDDIDLTILLTHIGFEADKELATILEPEWGVDMMIGGHSHTILEQPEVINDILITQAGVGSDQLGRFDITVDDDTNSIVDWKWQLLQVDENLAEPDTTLQGFIDGYQEVVDRKYNAVICRLARKLTHPKRSQETQLGNLFADILAERLQVDISLLVSGSIRHTQLGHIVTLGNFNSTFPYDGPVYKVTLAGKHLKSIFQYALQPAHRERYFSQVSKGVEIVYDETNNELRSFSFNSEPIDDEGHYRISLQNYSYLNPETELGIPAEALTAITAPQVATTSIVDLVEEYLRNSSGLNSRIEGRIVYE